MSSKIILTVVGVAVAGCVAAAASSWYTAQKLDEYVQAGVEHINRSHVMRASWYPKSSLPFSRGGVLHLVVLNEQMQENLKAGPVDSGDPESLQRVQEQMAEPLPEEKQKPLDLFINVSNSMFPFIVKGEATLDMSRGTASELVQRKAVPVSLPISMTWIYKAYNQDFNLQLSMDRWSVTQPEQNVNVGAAEVSLDGDMREELELNYAWEGVTATSKQPGLSELEIMPLDGIALLRNFSGIWISPEGHMQLNGIRSSGADGKVEMGQLRFDTVMDEAPSETGTMLNMKQRISLSKLYLDTQQERFNIDDFSLGLNFSGLNKQGMEELAQLAQAETPDFIKMMASLNKITTKTMRLELAPSSMKLNNGMITASGKLESLPFEVEQLMRASAADTPNPLRYMLQGDLTIAAESKAVLALPAEMRQQLATYQQQGFISTASTGLSSNMQLRGGELTANGQVIPLQDLRTQSE
ncbi:MAG: DUF945 family protein [Gammaproteobacteria bacterium]|nr:DUF945 family protein [Gammaproteobacteria bacterium]